MSNADRLETLEQEIVRSAAVVASATGRLLRAIREFDAGEGWCAQGARSCAAWLSWRVGVGVVAAREQVRVARALGDLPAIEAALDDGRLSYSKVRAMTRVATAANEGELLELAQLSTGAQLEKICRGYRTVRRELDGDDGTPSPERRLDWRWDDGMLVLQARLPADEGELVLQALRAVRDSLRREAGVADDRSPAGGASAEASTAPAPHPPDQCDALCATAETALVTGPRSAPPGRHQVVVHLHPDRAHLQAGPPLDLEGALRLACDAQLIPVRTDGRGAVLDVGRARRSIPPSIARALRLRDRGCRFPGCTCHRFVDAHHVKHWARGGQTTLENLVLLCRHHHRLLHEGGFTVTGDGAGFSFFDPTGAPVAAVGSPPAEAPAAPLPGDAPAAGHVGRWDCGWAVSGLLELDGLLRFGKAVERPAPRSLASGSAPQAPPSPPPRTQPPRPDAGGR